MQTSISLSSRLIFISDNSRLSALSYMPGKAAVVYQSGYMNALQRGDEVVAGSSYVTRVSRRFRRQAVNGPVSTAVCDGTKLQ